MNDKEFSRLQELIKQDKVLLEVSRRLSGAAFGGRIGGCLFPLVTLLSLAGIIFFIIKGLFLYAILCLVAGIVFFIAWVKVSYYYFYIRSIRNYDFFKRAYNSGVIRLHMTKDDSIISYPKPWNYAFEEKDT